MSMPRRPMPGLLTVFALALSAMACTSSESPDSPDDCPAAQESCSGTCRDVTTDVQHCGACGNACAAGSTCESGQCVAGASCGDGRLASNEACDDGNRRADDGCGATCAVEPGYTCSGAPSACATRCGDGTRAGLEACDDGNTNAGDGCSATCTVEGVFESEANDTVATANALSRLPARVFGTLSSRDDVDVYSFTLTTLSDLRIDTDDSRGPHSCEDIDTVVRLMDADGSTLASNDDDGLNLCSLLDPESNSALTRLRPGTYHVSVDSALFTGSAALPYGLNIQRVASCGDGARTGSEACDDGNTVDGDACTRFCLVPPSPEAEPNDTTATASGPLVPVTLFGGALSTASDLDLYRVTLTATSDLALEVFDEAGPASCVDIDPSVALLDASGNVVASDDDSGPGYCPNLSVSGGYRAMRRLAPGTWYVRVRSAGGEAIPAYTLRMRYEAVCGDGSVTGGEECDGGASCTSTCERVPVCGDGHLDAPEACDDGNTTQGDGCGRTCAVEGTSAEVEPNGTRAEADARASDGTPVRITGSTRLAGLLSSVEDLDLYRVEVAAPTVVRFESFHGGLQRCDSGADTQVRLRDAAGDLVTTSFDEGIELCGALTFHLAAATHYVEVSSAQSAEAPFAYVLDVAFLASVGGETEPNETLATATALSVVGSQAFVTATHPTAQDVDVYRITLPVGGRSLTAEITEGTGASAETCESQDMDSHLTLLDANGEQLASDDDSGRGYCSRIDGTGPSPADFGARNLPAGTYYLQVRSSSVTSGASAVFDYRLSVTLR
ncbi:DVUA0089 family protein [Pyxidicoccus sp. 3LG]